MQKMGSFVGKVVKSLKAEKALAFYRVKEAWLTAVGPVIAGQAEPTKLERRTLFVTVSSPHWSQEIQLHQRMILERLQKNLGHKPQKIVCWVGQPHQNRSEETAQPEPENTEVPWREQPIPPERKRRILATVSSLKEESLRNRLQSLLELSVKRELYLIEKGLIPCPLCSTLKPLDDEFCSDCLRQRAEERERALLRALAKKPWMSGRDLQDLAPSLRRPDILRLRKTLRTIWLTEAWHLSEGLTGTDLTGKMTPQLRSALEKIAMLTCSLPMESLQTRHFLYALGKRLGTAYLAARQISTTPDT